VRRTKIVATVGPATSDEAGMSGLLAAGADVLRFNAAHAAPAELRAGAARARELAAANDRTVGVLIDLPGPKVRTLRVAGDEVTLATGKTFVLTASDAPGDATHVGTTVVDLASRVRVGDVIYLADGEVVLHVERIAEGDVRCRIVRGGTLRSGKGMHAPRAEASLVSFTDADARALAAALRGRADYIGISFVRSPADVEQVRARLPKRGPRPRLVAKVETAAAIEHLSEIVEAADAVMVARGDLGIQLPVRRVPLLQKEIIRRCNAAGKPVVTATQMLESMTRSPLPTRAEVGDVANAIIDGTDALMLSEETAVGAYTSLAVRTMSEISEEAERWPGAPALARAADRSDDEGAWALAHAAVEAAEDLGVRAIVCPTRNGATAHRVAAFRPSMPVVAASSSAPVLGQLTLLRGVYPLCVRDGAAIDQRDRHGGDGVRAALDAARARRLLRRGDAVVVVTAARGSRAGTTAVVRIARA
jgi:pyruvate kinase